MNLNSPLRCHAKSMSLRKSGYWPKRVYYEPDRVYYEPDRVFMDLKDVRAKKDSKRRKFRRRESRYLKLLNGCGRRHPDWKNNNKRWTTIFKRRRAFLVSPFEKKTIHVSCFMFSRGKKLVISCSSIIDMILCF